VRRYQAGSLFFDRRRKVWYFRYRQNGTRKSESLGALSKSKAIQAADSIRRRINSEPVPSKALTVGALVEAYRNEKMPTRPSTKRGYEAWLKNHILPYWGPRLLADMQARPVELWLGGIQGQDGQPLSPKSKTHIRGLLHALWDYSMWRGDLEITRNPMDLVSVKGATKRTRKPRSLTVEEFQKLLAAVGTDLCWRTMLLVAVSFGLRISELLGLQWQDMDLTRKTVSIRRGVVKQIVGDVKSEHSAREMVCDSDLLAVLKHWHMATQFPAANDWMFPSLVKIGRQPLSYTHVFETLRDLADHAGLDHISSHVFRHTYRSWLDSVRTPVGVQQKLMRHADIRTTMNIYGDAASADMRRAHKKVVKMAIPAHWTATGLPSQ
jgi:integrase